MSRMFRSVTRTWNPQVGCLYGCVYCWARDLAETKLKGSTRYRNGFRPLFINNELRKRFKPGEFVFVTDMGDLFGPWVKYESIQAVLSCIARWPETTFLLQTKNPARFLEFRHILPGNVYLGTTIETNDYFYKLTVPEGVAASVGELIAMVGRKENKITSAPVPFSRYEAMIDPGLRQFRKFISIEPIMDFDLETMLNWMNKIAPSIIEVGADNYGHNLREPSWYKVQFLLGGLRAICPDVKEKTGLERLEKIIR